MKKFYYNKTLDFTSMILNLCIRFKRWGWVKHVAEFRKNHIVSSLRFEVKKP